MFSQWVNGKMEHSSQTSSSSTVTEWRITHDCYYDGAAPCDYVRYTGAREVMMDGGGGGGDQQNAPILTTFDTYYTTLNEFRITRSKRSNTTKPNDDGTAQQTRRGGHIARGDKLICMRRPPCVCFCVLCICIHKCANTFIERIG